MKTPRPKRTKRPRPPKPMTARKLIRATLREWRDNWKPYTQIIALVVLPLDIFGLSASLAASESINAFASVAIIIMNAVLTWAIIQRDRTEKVPAMLTTYYEGSIVVVRYMVAIVLLVFTLIPAAFGAILYLVSLDALSAATSIIEPILIAFICLLLAFVSLWMLVRFILSLTIIADSDLRPLEAMAYARRLTLGRFWRVTGRMLSLIGLIILIAVPIAAITAFLGYIRLSGVAILFFGFITTAIVLPISNIYLLRLYRDLERQVVTKADKVAEDKPDDTDQPDDAPKLEVDDHLLKTEPEVVKAAVEAAAEPKLEPTKLSSRRMDMVRPRHNLRYQPGFGEKIRRTK